MNGASATKQEGGRYRSTSTLIFLIPLCIALLTLISCAKLSSQRMSQELLAQHIEEIAGNVEGSPNVVEFEYEGVALACVSDALHDRMRLVAPIARRESIDSNHLEIMLTANFHTALDARYALSKGIVYATFLHPLSSLSQGELESAIKQVAALARNFGTSYSSDAFVYGAESGEEV